MLLTTYNWDEDNERLHLKLNLLFYFLTYTNISCTYSLSLNIMWVLK